MAGLSALRTVVATLSLAVAAAAVQVGCGDTIALPLNPDLETSMLTLRSTIQQLAQQLKRLHSAWRPVASLHELDPRTLADIGLHASEISSVEAESRGLSPISRLRIVRDVHHA